MITVIVKRGAGDRPGPDISDSLITSDQVAVDRGQAEIDKNCSDRAMVPTTGPLIGWVPPCSLVSVTEMEGTWRGVVNKCSLSFDIGSDGQFTARTDLEIEREI
jgi:hypothetical protein